ncbi:MAG: YtxH domain-containing protein [Propionibacteriales bacterium]|nr:YtxH domain-containing protein [Propionibacteriales bacterium]
MSKILLVAAGAAGYVLGARAGRERYDAIVELSQRAWTNPKVQRAAQDVQDRAREQAPFVSEKIGDAAKKAAETAKSKVTSSGSDTTSTNPNIAGPQGDLP